MTVIVRRRRPAAGLPQDRHRRGAGGL